VKRFGPALFVLFLTACLYLAACAGKYYRSTAHLMTAVQKSQKWDVFFFEGGKTKIIVLPAAKWRFEEGCFIAEQPIPYIQCEVFRVRPCTESCG